MILIANGRAEGIQLAQTEILVVPPAVAIQYHSDLRTDWQLVSIPKSILAEVAAHGGNLWRLQLPLNERILNDKATGRLFGALAEEHTSRGLASSLAIDALARLLLVEVLRQLERRQSCSTWVSLPPRQLRSILNFIEANLGNELRLADLAALQGRSPYYFCRIFKSATGLSPRQYVLRCRVARAKLLLANDSLDLAGIALESGFGSQSHFGTTFRRITGCTPKQFRQMAA
ncbi:MAG: helix-turn-helix transcriptional regulator [Bryobacteraceae bacterium]|nr:helix-turn-helix transcriptional regulator [Bryobacteraceae bacterium]